MQQSSISIAFAVLKRSCDVFARHEEIAYAPRGQQFVSSFSFPVNGVAGLAREWRKHAPRSSMTNGISHEPISFLLPFASSSSRERKALFFTAAVRSPAMGSSWQLKLACVPFLCVIIDRFRVSAN